MILGKWFGQSVVGVAVLAILPLGLSLRASADDSVPVPPGAIIARTVPSHTAKPTFLQVGIVKKWLVKPDDVVKKGQVLGIEDTDLEKLKLRAMEIEAKSTAKIEAATAAHDSKQVEYDRKRQLGQDASGSEVEEAKLDAQQTEAEIREAEMEHEKALADVDEQLAIIDKMQLIAPADGIVKEINIQEGEIVDPNKPDGALTLVTNNPLWVEAAVPSAIALKLKIGDDAEVAYSDATDNWIKGKVIYLDPEVTSGSDTETVRVEVQNDQNKVSGLWAFVRFPGQSQTGQSGAAPEANQAVGSAK